MFNPIRRRLTIQYTITFFILLLVIMASTYVLMKKAMDNQQLKELNTYYKNQQHDLIEYMDKSVVEDNAISYDANRSYYYYVFNMKQKIVHGDEQFYGFHRVLRERLPRDTSESAVIQVEWEKEHLLMLHEPILVDGKQLGFIVVGQSITDQYHFFQTMFWLFIIITCISTVILAFLSYYLAGKAMKPIEASFKKQKRFVSDASHELRTPLSIFYSSLELLDLEEKDKMNPLSQQVLSDLKSEAFSMNALLGDLLFLARHDHSKLKVVKEWFSLSDLISTIGDKYTRIIPDSIDFTMDIEKGLDIYGVKQRIKELIYILLDNAIQYTGKGEVHLALKRAENHAEVKVSDTGVGMSEADIEHIFERFFRSDTARARSGTGLGLPIAKTIVNLHNGEIKVTSQKGRGTCFIILLPIKN